MVSPQKIGIQLITWVLLIQVINLSIDPVDPLTYKLGRVSEDLTINDVESIFEFIAETFTSVEIPESDEDDINTFSKIFITCIEILPITIVYKSSDIDLPFCHYLGILESLPLDFVAPPPRLA